MTSRPLSIRVGGVLDGPDGPLSPHAMPKEHLVIGAIATPELNLALAAVMFLEPATPWFSTQFVLYSLSASLHFPADTQVYSGPLELLAGMAEHAHGLGNHWSALSAVPTSHQPADDEHRLDLILRRLDPVMWRTAAQLRTTVHALRRLISRGLVVSTGRSLTEDAPHYGYRLTSKGARLISQSLPPEAR